MTDPQNGKSEAPRSETRRVRQSRLLKAELLTKRLGKMTVTVRNVSEQGIGGKAPFELNLGERVQVTLPGLLPLLGTVRWTFEGQFGIQTDKEIALDALRSAYGSKLPGTEDNVPFYIQRPPQVPTKRPGLSKVSAQPGQIGTPNDYFIR